MIAEFMGYEFNEEHEFYVDRKGNCSTIEELRFNNSWDWLMPVIQKIYNYSVNLDSNKQFRMSHIIENFQMAVITMTPTQGHRFVCDAIELLNENK